MKRVSALLLGLLLLAGCSAEKTDLDNFEQKYSYALGQDIGRSLKNLPLDIEMEYMFQGVRDALADEQKNLLTDEEMATVMKEFAQKMQDAQKEKREASAKDNEDKGKAFREENGKKEGVTTTESGLQIETVTKGEGAKPKAEDIVTVHYTGTLIDGKEFDSSVKRGQPANFPLNGVIKGWTEGLQLMNVGGKYKLVVPPELAYGANGAGQLIGPNATLVFEIELISIGEPKPTASR